MKQRGRWVARTLAVLAAVCLVGAFALALAYPPYTSLQRVIARVSPTLVPQLGDWVRDHIGEWAWTAVLLPLFSRPGWLVVFAIGLITLGVAFSLRGRRDPDHAHGND